MTYILGLDIGGANTKACCLEVAEKRVLDVQATSNYFAMWEKPDGLRDILLGLKDYYFSKVGKVDNVALTMTAELCDGFASKAQGVCSILDQVEEIFTPVPVHIWTIEEDFRSPSVIRMQPLLAAAANWLASTVALARCLKDEGSVLFADMGSTTVDLIQIIPGKVLSIGKTDTERLLTGELLYSGLLRTPLHSLVDEVYLDGYRCQTVRESFAISADVYRYLDLIREEDYDVPTPDGRGRSINDCAQRLARVVGSEPEELGKKNIELMARVIMERQTRQVMDSILQVVSRRDVPLPQEMIYTGQGSFILREAARRLGWKARPWWKIIPGGKQYAAMTAYTTAWLLTQKLTESGERMG